MRRTRHVVLPVRSWEHVGLMMVSLACLTLGLVSRDREGQAGSLAGPDLQHCAPHKVDACPNENIFTRLFLHDDTAIPSGLTPIDQPKEYRIIQPSKGHLPENREDRPQLDNRDARSVRRASAVRINRSETRRSSERRDIRLSEQRDDRRSRQTRDSRSLEREFAIRIYHASSERRKANLAERRNEQRNQQIRMPRSLERDSANGNSRLAVERTREGQTDRLRSSERNSPAHRSRLASERRDIRLSEKRNDQRSRDFSARNFEFLIERSTERRDARISGRREERDLTARAMRLATDRRDDRRNREVRGVRSLQRDSVVRNSAITSERRDRNTRSIDRADPVTRIAQSLADRRSATDDFHVTNSPLTAKRRDDRLTRNRKIQGLPSTDRKSEARNSRLITGRRDVRLSERRDDRKTQRARLTPILNRKSSLENYRSVADRETERRNARLSVRRDDRYERREVRDARSYQRDTAIRNSRDVWSSESDFSTRSFGGLVAERRDNRLNRKIQGLRSLDRDSTARNSRVIAEKRNVQLSERQDRQRAQRNSRSITDRETERKDARLSVRRDERQERRETRNTVAQEHNNLIRNSRDVRSQQHVSERRDERLNRQARGIRFFERDSRFRNFGLTGERRDSRLSEHRDELLSRRLRDGRSLQESSARSTLLSITERRDNRVNDQIRDARSVEQNFSIRDARSAAEARNGRLIRKVRDLRSTERDSAVRTSLVDSQRVWIDSLRNNRNVRKELITRTAKTAFNARRQSERTTSKRRSVAERSTAEDRVDRSSRLRQTTERRQGVLLIRENLMENEKLGAERQQERMMRERSPRMMKVENNRDVHTHDRNRRIGKMPVTQDKLLAQKSRMISTNVLAEQVLPISSTYQGLRQTAILILCAVYGASLYSGKGSIPRNILTYINRFIIW